MKHKNISELSFAINLRLGCHIFKDFETPKEIENGKNFFMTASLNAYSYMHGILPNRSLNMAPLQMLYFVNFFELPTSDSFFINVSTVSYECLTYTVLVTTSILVRIKDFPPTLSDILI